MKNTRTTTRLALLPSGLAALALAATGMTPAIASTAPAAPPPHAGPTDCQIGVDAPLHEMRGVWIASVANIDWPSAPGISPEQAQAELTSWYDEAVEKGLNAVFVQVRPTADTFWPSELEPSSHWLTGEQGADFGGWDPMQFAVEEAHARGLDFHAWFNPYRVTQTGTDLSALAEGHPARENPDWVAAYGGRLYYNPGVPAAREHTINVIMEAVERYDIDGVHFDDYFYPYPVAGQEFPDADTFAEFGGDFEDIEDWRRNNVDVLIETLSERISEKKPWVQWGVSPFAVWRNVGTDPAGSNTTAGAQTYDDLYADTRLWIEQEWMDYVIPQIYWAIGFEPAAYEQLVPWWSEQVTGTDVALWIGEATYKVGTSPQSPEWMEDPEEMVNHLNLLADYPEVTGNVWFSANQIRANRLGHWDLLQEAHYANPALPPALHPGTTAPTVAPTGLSTHRHADGTELRWHQRGHDHGFAVYKVDTDPRLNQTPCRAIDADNLVAVLGDGARSWVDPDGGAGSMYVVTALAQDNTQSEPSRPVRGR
ncbi:glycoside hydrolase family 10 protein [Ornithinimicrobium sp. Y1847]|uniref:glycoside hydrolase family 10 protein n=1 Tax=Ornithinimicrobium sp. Y1847 TaxID=3405419 RepID=UPI003B674188